MYSVLFKWEMNIHGFNILFLGLLMERLQTSWLCYVIKYTAVVKHFIQNVFLR